MSHFLDGFVDENIKIAESGGHPLFEQLSRGGTLLGQKVDGMVSRSAKRGAKARSQAKRGAGLKKVLKKTAETPVPGSIPKAQTMEKKAPPPVPTPAPPPTRTPPPTPMPKLPGTKAIPLNKRAEEEDKDSEKKKDKAGGVLEEVLRAALKGDEDKPVDAEGSTVPMGVDDPSYGGGKGMPFGGKQRAPWTDEHNPTDKPNAQFGSGSGCGKTAAAGAALMAALTR